MLDFEVQRCTRRCAATERELKPGETFYSVLVQSGSDVKRLDYSEGGWTGAPPDALAWWKSSMPSLDASKMHWAPSDVMLRYFEQLEGDPAQADVRYVLALLLVRRRIVRHEGNETDDAGRETMMLYCPRNENQYQALVVPPSTERIAQIQQDVGRLLFGSDD